MDNVNDSMYVRYKKSGQRAVEALQTMVQSTEIFASSAAGGDALLEATDYSVEHDIEVSSSLLSDLKQSIRLRKRVAKDHYGGGDAGHANFIDKLEYCWSHLCFQRQKQLLTKAATTATITTSETDSDNVASLQINLKNSPQPTIWTMTTMKMTYRKFRSLVPSRRYRRGSLYKSLLREMIAPTLYCFS